MIEANPSDKKRAISVILENSGREFVAGIESLESTEQVHQVWVAEHSDGGGVDMSLACSNAWADESKERWIRQYTYRGPYLIIWPSVRCE